jgi:2-amino-4-hydroxy-6-hydroxymethyldihydropteridine diphosphokinase
MRCCIALGSNLGDRLQNLRAAAARITTLAAPGSEILRSRVYETEPVGCEPGAAPFLNAVMEIDFPGSPDDLLAQIRAIERDMGRAERRPKNAPRTIDLDILCAGGLVLDSPHLTLPHPRMTTRRFVLAPLADIRPELILPGQEKTVAQLLDALPPEPPHLCRPALPCCLASGARDPLS